MLEIRDYDHERDFSAVRRIHFEVGWISDAAEAKAFKRLVPHLTGVVIPINGDAECAVFTCRGAMRHLQEDVDMLAVLAVTTSHVARKLGAAKVLTAHSLAEGAQAGAEVAALGMFDQGFYDRLGFGTGSYARRLKFDPATLTVKQRFRPPKRIGKKQWREVHGALHGRRRGHGGCVLDVPEILRDDLAIPSTFCLGYYDGPRGTLSHFIWGEAKDEHGPYHIYRYAYQTPEQLFELLALIKSLGDQVSSVTMQEPPEIQMQDLLRQPFRNRGLTAGARNAATHETSAYWQARILDLSKCLAKTRLDAESVTFNLRLTDPVTESLGDQHDWRGVAGDYVVTLGQESNAEPGASAKLPTLRASVGAFSRMWLGVRSASSLALTDDLRGDGALLVDLDRALRLPSPHFGWDF